MNQSEKRCHSVCFFARNPTLYCIPRATVKVPAPLHIHPRPYNDNASGLPGTFMVRAGVVEREGGDLYGRPGPLTLLVSERLQRVWEGEFPCQKPPTVGWVGRGRLRPLPARPLLTYAAFQ